MTHVTREPDRCVRENDVLRRRVAALEADAERFKATLRSINDAVIATDANGQVLQMNRMSEELTGWHEAEARGRPISEVFRIVNEETDPAGERSGTAVLGEVDVAGLAHHAVLITRDGTRRPVTDSVAPVRDEKGAATGVVLVFRDQTEMRAAHRAPKERVLEQNDTASRAVVGSLPQKLCVKDRTSVYVAVNERFATGLGCRAEQFVGNDDFAFYPTGPAEEHRADHHQVTESGRVKDTEESYLTQGKKCWVRTITAPVRDDAGEVIAVVGLSEDITERKRREHALEASETRYRRLFESAKDGILILDADTGKIVDVNPFLTELTGYSHEHFLGKHIWEIGLFKDVAASRASFADLQAQRYVRYEDLPLEARDGRKVEVEFISNVYRAGNQSVIQCNIRDISARKRAEQLILEQRATLNAILESAGAPVFALDREYRYTAFNRSHAVVMKAKYGADIQLGGSLAEYQSVPEDWRAARKNLDRALRGETVLESESSGNESLSRCYFEVAHHPVRTDAGEVIGVSVIASEVTARKRAEDELRFRNLILSTQQEASLDGILVVDVHGTIVSSNRRFAEIWGIPLDLLESNFDERVLQWTMDRAADPAEFISTVKHLYANPDAKSHSEIALKDGRTLDRYSAPMLGGDGKGFGRVWQFRDITARKRVEEEREKLEEQLRMSQKMEAIGCLAGGVAHDFNNLLCVILNYTDLALEAARDGGPPEDDLMEVKKAGEHAAALTRQLLAFSRKQVLQPVPVNLNDVADGVGKMLRRILGEDIDLVQKLAPDLGLTLADVGQIEQVLMNLAVNARDAMPEGGKLVIETANVELDEEYAARHVAVSPGMYVQLVVTDTGSGMDRQTKARLFEPFFTTKQQGKGTGLGLSTVYGIIKQSGGNIWVYSEPGQGTTFRICLPRECSATAVATGRSPTVPRRVTGTETVLVVEDAGALREVARRALAAAGYTVLTAADGEEALLTGARHVGDIHLLVTDVVMPRLGGRALARELSRIRPALKVLYMSGYTDDAIVHHGVLETGTHFLGKPFTATVLKAKVREVLDGDLTDVADLRLTSVTPRSY